MLSSPSMSIRLSAFERAEFFASKVQSLAKVHLLTDNLDICLLHVRPAVKYVVHGSCSVMEASFPSTSAFPDELSS